MIKVELKDGSIMEIEQGSKIIDVAKRISEGLARMTMAGKIDGQVQDLRYEINKDCKLEILTFDSLDGKKAYVLGLVHDIGRRAREHVGLRHIIEGYNYLKCLGYDEEARVCLTHTFYARNLVIPNLTKKNTNLTRNEIDFIADYINKNGFNIYDKILQIADNMGSASGINTIERRRTESMLRYGITDISEKNLQGIFNVQAEIEEKLGASIYYLFPEVTDNISKTLIKDVVKIKK